MSSSEAMNLDEWMTVLREVIDRFVENIQIEREAPAPSNRSEQTGEFLRQLRTWLDSGGRGVTTPHLPSKTPEGKIARELVGEVLHLSWTFQQIEIPPNRNQEVVEFLHDLLIKVKGERSSAIPNLLELILKDLES